MTTPVWFTAAKDVHRATNDAGVGVGEIKVQGPLDFFGASRGQDGPTSGAGLTAQQKAQYASQSIDAVLRIYNLPFEDFPAPSPPKAPPVQLPPRKAVQKSYRKPALSGIGFFDFSARSAAKARADAEADRFLATEQERLESQRQQTQGELDREWQGFLANEPAAVLDTVNRAFADNEAPAAALGADGDKLEVVVLVPGPDLVPQTLANRTAGGNATIKKATKSDQADLYKFLVCGYAVVTVREAFASAPGINWVNVTAFRLAPADSFGAHRIEPMLCANFPRHALEQVRWKETDATNVVNDAGQDLVAKFGGAGKALQPIPLREVPQAALTLQKLVAQP